MKALYILFNTILEAVYFLLFPFIYLYLRYKNYLGAILMGKPEQIPPLINKQQGNLGKRILFHAASMGEVNAIKPVVLRLLKQIPEYELMISTSTVTGLELAKSISPKVKAFLSSLDVWHLRNKQLNSISPNLICVVETEIWLNMLGWAKLRRVPVIFINGRMSARSLRFYRFIKLLLQYLETPILAIHAQSSINAERFAAVFNKPVFNSSNLKYALYLEEYDSSSMRKEWGFRIDDFIICWGSSRPGEEALLISILPELSLSIPNLKIIIAPRHLERLPELQNLLKETNYRKYSDRIESISGNILLIDEMGVLPKAYAICDIAIVGGSFMDFGGHNPLEPAFYSRPIVIGEFHNSCKESVTKLQENAGIMISDAKSLLHDLQKLASNPALRTKMGKNSCQVLRNNSSALNIQLEAIIQAASEN